MQKLDYRYQSAWKYTTNSIGESPIAIDTKLVVDRDAWLVDWSGIKTSPIRKNAEVTGDQFYCEGELQLNGQSWQLIRFHVHDGAEHLVDGRRFAAEIHFVCQNDQGQTMVLAILATEDHQQEPLLTPLFQEKSKTADLQDFLPKIKSLAYSYVGTLTTPPLQQGIRWFLLAEPLGINQKDLATFKQAYSENHRDCQPLAGRVVERHPLRDAQTK
ncbi:carbonic anhydrase family protein [Fructobacillus pseudoficulneus]|nr:carbonic anhydrase family protein [Fructobacillus pseudoficulneus]SEH44114.1 carbonic anhydrase [Fructobacillus pseudoficulneus]